MVHLPRCDNKDGSCSTLGYTVQILNKHHHPDLRGITYIGRGSPLGNPWTHMKGTTKAEFRVATREEAILKYEQWLADQVLAKNPTIMAALRELNEDSKLLCFCAPLKCHAEAVQRVWAAAKYQGLI